LGGQLELHVTMLDRTWHPHLKILAQSGSIPHAHALCHKSCPSSVMYIVNARSETFADITSNGTSFDLETLFLAHYPRVVRIIGRVVRDAARSEELAVEVFLKLWRNQKAVAENVEGWLYRVAVRTGVDELRRQTRRAHYERLLAWVRPRSSPPTPEEIHSAAQEQERVRSILSILDTRQAQFLLLRSQDFSYSEMAAILELNPASVGTFLGRAQESFRKEYIKKYGQD
jgi:RNA polymerase sigma-70 factor, ECF subfamily